MRTSIEILNTDDGFFVVDIKTFSDNTHRVFENLEETADYIKTQVVNLDEVIPDLDST